MLNQFSQLAFIISRCLRCETNSRSCAAKSILAACASLDHSQAANWICTSSEINYRYLCIVHSAQDTRIWLFRTPVLRNQFLQAVKINNLRSAKSIFAACVLKDQIQHCWWYYTYLNLHFSLIATIKEIRPDLLQNRETSSLPISPSPSLSFFGGTTFLYKQKYKNTKTLMHITGYKVPGVGELMLASFSSGFNCNQSPCSDHECTTHTKRWYWFFSLETKDKNFETQLLFCHEWLMAITGG